MSAPRGVGRQRSLTIANVLVAVAAALGIVVLLNYFAALPKLRKQIDVTSVGSNTISPKTLGILEGLEARLGRDEHGKPRVLHAVSFLMAERVPEDEAADLVRRALELYQSNARGALVYERIDPYQSMSAALAKLKELSVQQSEAANAVVLKLGERVKTIPLTELVRMSYGGGGFMGRPEQPARIEEDRIEETLTSAILGLLESTKPKVYFVAGHGEPPIDETDRMGLASFAEALRKSGYEAAALDARAPVPEDARVVVWIGPTKPMAESELAALRAYVRRGGRLFVAFDVVDEGGDADVLALLAQLSIRSPAGIVCEPIDDPLTRALFVGTPECAYVRIHPDNLSSAHPVTKSIAAQRLVLPFLQARALERLTEGGSTALVEDLARTTKDAWIDQLPPDFDFRSDREREAPGVRTVMAASTWKKGVAESGPASAPSNGDGAAPADEGRAIVLGSTLTLRNESFGFGRDLAVSSIEWLAGREFAAGIGPRPSRQESLADVTTISSKVSNALLGLTFGAFAGAGAVVWRRRRQKPGLVLGLLFGAAAVVCFAVGWLA